MDIIEKLNRLLADTTAHAQGSVDISQGPYGSNIMGMRYIKKKKKIKGGAEYNMHEENDYKITVIVKKKKYKKTFNVKAPTEGKAKTRALNMAFQKGLKLMGDEVEYKINESHLKVGQKVKFIDKDDVYYGKTGKIYKVFKNGYTVKIGVPPWVISRADDEVVLNESILKPGSVVKVPHKGKMTKGKVVRYDKGSKHGTPFYVVNVGEYESLKVPVHKIK